LVVSHNRTTMMYTNFRPRLRQHVQLLRDPRDPLHGYLVDHLRQCPEAVRLALPECSWLPLFDGQRTLREIEAAAGRPKGALVPLNQLAALTDRLDEALLLEGPRWQKHLDHPEREPSCIGCYEADPDKLRLQVEDLFTRSGGPGLPRGPQPDGRLRAALVPHMDYARGGVCYSFGFKEIFERAEASLFVIIGTSHHSPHRFTLTRKNFKTPLGVVPTDQDFIDCLVRHYGNGLFDDQWRAHLPEHAIELEVVLLQWYYARRKPIRIVPLVVGAFDDATQRGRAPAEFDDIGRMIEALKRAEAQTKEPICYLISGDLAHLGPKFNPGRAPLESSEIQHSQRQDRALLGRLEDADLAGYFRILTQEKDVRAICGFPPTYTVLEALKPRRGKMLNYSCYKDPSGFESVSFASMAFYC
jgi:AmmeMemoRadiSam system protein B